MKISDYLKKDHCVMELKAENKEEAIKEIVYRLQSSEKILHQEEFIKDILEREDLGSTGIGYGVAIPHARTKAVKDFVIGFGKSLSGIEFNALDGQKVNLIFLMGANLQKLNLYLRLLAELSKLLMNELVRKELLSANECIEIIEVIKKFEIT
ncbi:MAG TPA: PTS sugar transporter subunit IIA [Candidatus Omnitrophica bacterium]|nr:PTS sugar transporter subunit IIA [Candidatus Omnitrophota bacterium]